jgi:hypothetical protein
MDWQPKLEQILKEPIASCRKIIANNSQLLAWLKNRVGVQDASISELIFLYRNSSVLPICEKGNKKKFKSYNRGYGFCGNANTCACNQAHKSLTQKNIQKTRTALEKSRIQLKKTNTTLLKYGVDHHSKSQSVKQKKKETFLKKYGVDHNWKNPASYHKSRETCKEKFGEYYPQKKKEIYERILRSRNQTMIEKYGVTSNAHFHLTDEQISILTDKNKFKHLIENKTFSEIFLKLPVDRETIGRRAEEYGFLSLIKRNAFESSLELKIEEVLKQHNIEYVKNDRTLIFPNEIDFFLPQFNVGIELNGIYWHSELGGKKSPSYHYKKWKRAQEKKINLYQFFEDDVSDRFHIIKSKILYLTGNVVNSVYARDLKFVRCDDFLLEQQFYDKNHLQGSTKNRNHTFLLEQDGIIYAALSTKRNNMGQLEVVRYASDVDFRVVGGFSKLLTNAVKILNFQGEVISYSDNLISNGNLYSQNAFKAVRSSFPGYWFTDYLTKFHWQRINNKEYQEKIDKNKSRWQNAQELGWDRIWDAGKTLWQKSV